MLPAKVDSFYTHQFPLISEGSVTKEIDDAAIQREFTGSIRYRKVDFSIHKPWQETAKKVVLLILKIVIVPWGLIEGLRFLTRYLIVKLFFSEDTPSQVDNRSVNEVKNLRAKGYYVKQVVLEKGGIRYRGLLAGNPATLHNGKWALLTEGIGGGATDAICGEFQKGFNVLSVDPAGIGRSQGPMTPQTIGDSQDVALRFLEEALKAHHIIMSGYSFGVAVLGQGVLQHEFKPDVQYAMISDMGFNKLSNSVGWGVKEMTKSSFLAWLAPGFVKFAGLEIDNIKAAKKLSTLNNVRHIVIQASREVLPEELSTNLIPDLRLNFEDKEPIRIAEATRLASKKVLKKARKQLADQLFAVNDTVIDANASLARSLVKDGIFDRKTFIAVGNDRHRSHEDLLPEALAPFLSDSEHELSKTA